MEQILILGGTNFIGRNLVEKLISNKKYELTLLNRGTTNSKLFPKIKKISGDRNHKDIGNLVKGDWDYVIDLSCYYPRSLKNIIESLSPSIKKYIFISTCSVYVDEEKELIDESAPIQVCNVEDYDDETNASYGKRKSKCEEILESSDLNYTILRPSLVFGQYDHTDRFYYWLHQVKKYQKILIPVQGEQKMSLTYVHDLTETITQSITSDEDRNIYNMISHLTVNISEIIKITSKLLEKSPTLINASSKYLKDKNISEWFDMPLWIDSDFSTFNNEKILKNYKIKMTEFEKSIKDTIQYYDDLNWHVPKYGITRSKQLGLMMDNKKQNTPAK